MVFHTLGAENYFLLTFEIESTNKKQGRDDVAVWFFFKCWSMCIYTSVLLWCWNCFFVSQQDKNQCQLTSLHLITIRTEIHILNSYMYFFMTILWVKIRYVKWIQSRYTCYIQIKMYFILGNVYGLLPQEFNNFLKVQTCLGNCSCLLFNSSLIYLI